MESASSEVTKRGIITIPKPIREANGIRVGQQFSFHALGGGVLLLSPRVSRIDEMCDRLRDELQARGATLEEMLEELRKTRESEDA